MVAWKNVEHSEIGDSPLRDVEDVLKIPYLSYRGRVLTDIHV